MGIQLVKAATVYVLPELERHHKARVALIVMATMAQDSAEHPVYFGGWRHIARALGLAGTNDTQRTAVSKVWITLKTAGYIAPASNIASPRATKGWLLLRERWENPMLPEPVDNPRPPPF